MGDGINHGYWPGIFFMDMATASFTFINLLPNKWRFDSLVRKGYINSKFSGSALTARLFFKRESLYLDALMWKFLCTYLEKKLNGTLEEYEISFTPRFIKSCFEKILVLNTTYWRWVTSGYHAMIQPIRTKEGRKTTDQKTRQRWVSCRPSKQLSRIKQCLKYSIKS